jgi:hypothetical protein
VGPWNAETKCGYCGSVFLVHRGEEQRKDDDDMALKAAAFKDSVYGTGGEELYPAPNEAERESHVYRFSDALVGMFVGVVFSLLFTGLAMNAYITQDMGGFIVFVLLTALFVFIIFVCFHFLPKDQQTRKLPDYGGD